MVGILEVTYQDIERLSDVELTELLSKLLYLEVNKFGIKKYRIDVSLKINQGDGGSDGEINWFDQIQNTDFIPNMKTIFQCKQRQNSSGFSKTHCEKELIYEDDDEIFVKEAIDNLFNENGSYILFFNQACSPGMLLDRKKGFQNGLLNAKANYAESCDIQIYDANKIAKWTNQYIQTVLYVQKCVSNTIPINIQRWDELNLYQEYRNPFFIDKTRSNQISEIQQLSGTSKNVIRVYGNSGLGKTRLVLEAFRPPKNKETEEEQKQFENYQRFVYYNAQDQIDIITYFKHFCQSGLSGTVVIDECDCSLHRRLAAEVTRENSNLSLITIDFAEKCLDRDTNSIIIEKMDNTAIKAMIENLFPDLVPDDIEKIIRISDGYPKMAVLIAKERKYGSEFAVFIDQEEIIDKLIGGRNAPTAEQKKVIEACSLFSAFGINGNVKNHEIFIAKKICHMEIGDFHRILMEIKEKRDIIESIGERYIQISPKPLAITLATRWWRHCHINEAEDILIKEDLCNLQLLDPLCEQFRYLKLEPEIQELTDELCGVGRYFGQAETLNSERGSRVFRSIAEVNPSAAVNALERCFGDLSKEDLKKVGTGRRNLIWTLENLCFWEEHFQNAAKILLKFAVSETEPSIANNATGIFCQLYYYLLSGTQAPPEKRLEVIDYGLSTEDSDYQRICLNALKNALQTHHFSRIRGVEEQGSRYAEEDWRPKIWQDVYNYWDKSLEILTDYAIQKNQIGDQAKEIVQKSIDGLLFKGQLDTIEKSIFKVHNSRQEFWPEILYSLKAFLNRYRDKIPEDAQKRIEGWILEFGPKSFRDELYTIVINPEIWEVHDSENWLEESGIRVKDFAEKIAIDPVELYQNFEYIYSIEGNSLHSFGYYLGEFLPDKQEFINRSIGSLKGIDEDKQNISLLGGFLSALDNQNSKLVFETLERFGKDHDLKHWLIPLTSRKKVKKEDLERILPYLNDGSIDPVQISVFVYGSVLSELHPRDLTDFLDFILDNFKDCTSLVIEIIHMYTFKDDEKFEKCIPFIQKLISQKSLLQLIMQFSNADHYLYDFSEIITKLLNQSKPDINSAKELTYRIIEFCRDRDNRDFVGFVYSYGRKILCEILSEKYVKDIWEIFVNAIIDEKQSIYYTFSMLLDKENVGFGIQGNFSIGLIHKIPLEMVEKSCIKYPSLMPYFYTETMTPIIKIVDEEASTEDLTKYKYVWSELANYLLENYGTNKDILNSIDSNFENYSFINSPKEYYEIILSAMLDIKNSKNVCVREWARKNIDRYEQKIKSAESEEQERDLDFLPPPMFY